MRVTEPPAWRRLEDAYQKWEGYERGELTLSDLTLKELEMIEQTMVPYGPSERREKVREALSERREQEENIFTAAGEIFKGVLASPVVLIGSLFMLVLTAAVILLTAAIVVLAGKFLVDTIL